jgi:acyl-CoA thioesterase-1
MLTSYLRAALVACLVLGMMAGAGAQGTPGKTVTLRSLGAVGDGKTDDRAAIQAALSGANGATVDGEGLTYAVKGNLEVTSNIDFRNAKLVQTQAPADTSKFFPAVRGQNPPKMDPPDTLRAMVKGLPVMQANGVGTYAEDPVPTEAELALLKPGIMLRTLTIRGDDKKLISVKLEHIRIDRGRHPQSGGRSDGAGLTINYAAPVELRDVEITGDGKGTGLGITGCKQVRIERMNIHDMIWAPYAGDDVLDRLTAAEVRDDFGWNNFPIYEYRDKLKRFARVRIQEQLVGMFLQNSEDVVVADSRIERLGTKIGNQFYPLQCDGMTVNRVKNSVIRNCQIAKVWEGIDFTGGGGQDFVFEGCTASDTLGWAFKLAHPKQNGKIINCTAIRGGLAGFLVGGETENVTLTGCRALETGGNNYWTKADGTAVMVVSGYRIEGNGDASPLPRQIHVEHCTAINKEHPGAMEFGIFCQAKPAGRDITLNDFKCEGAKTREIEGIVEGVAGTTTPASTVATAAATTGGNAAEEQAWYASVHPKYKTWDSFKYVQETPGLPRVLIIGDSISIGYTNRVQAALKGKVNVWRIPTNAGSTKDGLEHLDQWLAWRPKWDVIHFNFGLHDLKHQKAGSPNPDQLDVTGTVNVPVEQYTENLEKLVTRLEQTGAKLIWGATTPLPDGAAGRVRGDEVKYNAAAEQVMKKHGIRIDDLYTCVLPQLAAVQNPKDVHFKDEGSNLLAKQVADEIMSALGTPPAH